MDVLILVPGRQSCGLCIEAMGWGQSARDRKRGALEVIAAICGADLRTQCSLQLFIEMLSVLYCITGGDYGSAKFRHIIFSIVLQGLF